MGFLNKIKDILFEEVEEEETIKGTNNKKEEVPEIRKPIAERIEPQKRVEVEQPVRDTYKEQPQMTQKQVIKEDHFESLNERDLFKSENTFPFPDFDEEEFSQNMSRVQQTKPRPITNVLEYEKKRKVEKKYDLGRYERIDRTEMVEKKRFKPSPIISPVYGILNEDYKPEDIKDKTDYNKENNLDFNAVRKKAFGDVEKLEEIPKETYYEETVTVKLKEPEEEKLQKVKTIDELLEDTADMAIEVEKEPIKEYEKIDDELEEIKIEEPKNLDASTDEDDDATLESDLFDLIDSMYDNREEGEY